MLTSQNTNQRNNTLRPKDGLHQKTGEGKNQESIAKILFTLQARQQVHDERYHKDIWCLPFDERIKHMVLHFAKYTGKFIVAKESHDIAVLRSTLIDSFIITLASANMLNLKLSCALNAEDAPMPDLHSLGESFLFSDFSSPRNPYTLAAYQLGKLTGTMAKACESRDHMEAFDSRGALEGGIAGVAKLCLAVGALIKFDLVPAIETRWREIEAKSIF